MIYLSNLQPDPQDSRDFLFEVDRDAILPDEVDLSMYGGYRENQLTVGSCTAQTAINIGEMYRASAGLFDDTPADDDGDLSARFNYYTSRELIGPEYLQGDPGSTARYALRAANKLGISRLKLCPYDIDKMNERPAAEAYADAENYKLGQYSRIPVGMNDDMIFAMMYALAKGWPIAVGLRVGQKIFKLQAGEQYPFLHPITNPYAGNHEMLIVGYKRLQDRVLLKIENSWGPNWCENGYFWTSALVVVVDMIDLWVAQGFAGIERVGLDRTMPKPVPVEPPKPEPMPVPVSPPSPDPMPPQPEPQPGPLPAPDPVPPQPQPEKKGGNGAVIAIAAILGILILAHFGGFI